MSKPANVARSLSGNSNASLNTSLRSRGIDRFYRESTKGGPGNWNRQLTGNRLLETGDQQVDRADDLISSLRQIGDLLAELARRNACELRRHHQARFSLDDRPGNQMRQWLQTAGFLEIQRNDQALGQVPKEIVLHVQQMGNPDPDRRLLFLWKVNCATQKLRMPSLNTPFSSTCSL